MSNSFDSVGCCTLCGTHKSDHDDFTCEKATVFSFLYVLNPGKVGGYTDAVNRVQAYLYDHTTIARTVTTPRWIGFVLATDAVDESRAKYLADYQAGRLASGMYNITVCAQWLDGAFVQLCNALDVKVQAA